MARDIEHIVETHQLAMDRRAAGLPIWDRTFDVSDVFHNESLTFVQKRDTVVDRLRRSRWFKENEDLAELADGLESALEEVSFDFWWDLVYDAADMDRVWIETH